MLLDHLTLDGVRALQGQHSDTKVRHGQLTKHIFECDRSRSACWRAHVNGQHVLRVFMPAAARFLIVVSTSLKRTTVQVSEQKRSKRSFF